MDVEEKGTPPTIYRTKQGRILTTKIHTVVDALGNPLRILLTHRNVNDIVSAATLIKEGLSADKLLADRA